MSVRGEGVGAEGRKEPGTTTAAGWWDLAKAPCFRSHLPALWSGACSIRAEWTRPQGQRGHNLSEAAVPAHWAIWRYWWLKVTFISSTLRVVIDPALASSKHPHHFAIVWNFFCKSGQSESTWCNSQKEREIQDRVCQFVTAAWTVKMLSSVKIQFTVLTSFNFYKTNSNWWITWMRPFWAWPSVQGATAQDLGIGSNIPKTLLR